MNFSKHIMGAVFWLVPYLAYAAILRVPDEYSTIQAAVHAATDGDTVLIADGVFSGAGNRGISWDATNKHLVIRSENGRDHSIIDCQGEDRAFFLNQGQDQRDLIQGLTVTNGWVYGSGGAILLVKSSPRIIDCKLENNTSYGPDTDQYYGGGGIAVFDSAAPTIQGNIIRNNTASRDGGGIRYYENASGVLANNIIDGNRSNEWGGGGIAVELFSSPTIINNLIVNNVSDSRYDGGFGGGISSRHSGPMIINNTIVYNSTGNKTYLGKGGGIAITKWLPQPVIRNCIIWSNESAPGSMNIQFEWNQWMDISYCNVEEDLGHIFDLLPHTNIDAAPGFIDPVNGNFQLLPGSPSMNTGTPDTTGLHLPSQDLAGIERVFDDRVDMGAYEYYNPTGHAAGAHREEFRIYPNPGSGWLFLECQEHILVEDLLVLIFDASGKKVYEEKVGDGEKAILINISQHADGLYFLTVLSRGQVLYKQKLVKL